MKTPSIALIGGTGLYRLAALDNVEEFATPTPYGDASGPVRIGQLGAHTVAFLARHGESHSVPPHRINYRANLWLLREAGAKRIVAVNAVGGITQAWAPAVLGLPDQLIDYTWGRISTLCEEPGTEVLHVDFGDPYTPALRRALLAAAKAAGVDMLDGGCYGVTQGPRLETRAEVARLRRDGCDLVGMTAMPEAALARELGLDYACLALVANWAAGCGPEPEREITMDEVLGNVERASQPIPDILRALLGR
jgi:5'-methylthioinosine phosphorylase